MSDQIWRDFWNYFGEKKYNFKIARSKFKYIYFYRHLKLSPFLIEKSWCRFKFVKLLCKVAVKFYFNPFWIEEAKTFILIDSTIWQVTKNHFLYEFNIESSC
jgi:hypothetical protein